MDKDICMYVCMYVYIWRQEFTEPIDYTVLVLPLIQFPIFYQAEKPLSLDMQTSFFCQNGTG